MPIHPDPEVPSIPPRARTVTYLVCLLVDVVAFAGFGLAALFGWLPPTEAVAAGAIVTGAVGMVSAGLALGYRPTRQAPPTYVES